MREIKFRIWNNDKKMWCPDDQELIYGDNIYDNIHLILKPDRDNVIIQQFTGLKDKNGKDIYEGDILKDDVGDILEVKFGKLPLGKSGDCVCSYKAFYCKNYGRLGFSPINECEDIGNWMEIIGNIFENPEIINHPLT